MELAFWADVADVAGTVTIVAGLLFGFIQVREYRQQRYDAVASELMRSFYDSELTEAVALLQGLQDELTLAEFSQLEPRYLTAALKVGMTFETIGLLVYRRIAPFELVIELTGGLVQVQWRKLERYVRDIRERDAHPSFAEWFEWLAIMAARHKPNVEPAYRRGADWVP